ncbi:MAG TPA: diguanylate cyclase [Gallionella sp.]|nr:diguanylate cyclase [Gallionella sp.]
MVLSSGCRILLVEDDASDASLLRQSLQSATGAGFAIHWVKSLAEAQRYLRETQPDIVLLDLSLPDSSGLETVHAGRQAAGALPIIVLTGHNDPEFALKTLEAGAQDYLIKGDFQPGDMIRAIRYAISRARLEQRLYEAEERWRFALEGAGDGVWDWDVQTDEVQFSARLKEMLGYAEGEMKDHLDEWKVRIHPDDKLRVMADVQAYFEGKSPTYLNEHRLRCRNGEWKWILHRGMLVSRNADGGPLRMIGTFTDISKLKQTEDALKRNEAFLKQTQQISQVGGWEYDALTNHMRWTDEAYRIYELPTDYDPNDVSRVLRFFAPLDQAVIERAFKRAVELGEPYDLELQLVGAQGTRKWIRTTGQAERIDGKVTRVFGNMMDITKSKQADEMLRLSSTVFNTVDEAILVSDADNRIITVNPAFTRVTGYQPEDVIGENPHILSSGKHGAEFYRELWLQLTSNGSWSGEVWNRRKNGELYVEWTSIKQVRDQHGKLTHYVAAFSDITERKANEASIRHQAQYDALTDLPNRVLLFDRLRQALAQAKRDRTRLALMYLDLDKFKPINDNQGHAIGDQLLQEVARRMHGCVRAVDTVARIGGDEFVVLLPIIENEQDALRVAEKIRAVLNQAFEIAGQSLHISSSTGIAIYPEHGTTENELTGNADIAMYHAKESGRDNVKLFQMNMRESA